MHAISSAERHLGLLEDGLLEDVVGPRAHQLHKCQLGGLFKCRERAECQEDGHAVPDLSRHGFRRLLIPALHVEDDFKIGECRGKLL